MQLILGNRNYSSWSLRGWLAAKQSGLTFEEIILPMGGGEWAAAMQDPRQIKPSGTVPILWDGPVGIWDSLAILEYFADHVGRDRFWPQDDAARAMARSMVAEMHSSFTALRRDLPMNMRRRFDAVPLQADVQNDAARIADLWAQARAQFGASGPFLFGAFGAADIFYAPIVSRFLTYGVEVPQDAQTYMQAVWDHDWMQQWLAAAQREPWEIEKYEAMGVPG